MRGLVPALLRRHVNVPDDDQVVPQEVTAFVHDHIDRLETLHVLLLLQATAPRPWSIRDVSVERQSSAYSAEISLRQLHRAGLLARDERGRFRFEPRAARLAEQTAWLVSWYQARPSSVIALIFSARRAST